MTPIRPGVTPHVENVIDQPESSVTATTSRLLRSGFASEVTTSDGKVVLRLYGELDLATAPALASIVDTALASKPVAISLDLSELTFLDSTGINLIISVIAGPQALGARSSFAHHAPPS